MRERRSSIILCDHANDKTEKSNNEREREDYVMLETEQKSKLIKPEQIDEVFNLIGVRCPSSGLVLRKT